MKSVYHTRNDQDLYALIKDGNQSAFAELYNRHKGSLYLHAYRMLQDDEEAKDVIQEVFSLLWSRRFSININIGFENYLYGMVKNRILNFLAHQKVMDRYSEYLNNFVDTGVAGYDEQLVHKELLAIIRTEVEQLPSKMRTVFELSRYEGLSNREVAERLNISDKTVKKQLNNAAKILKPKIGMSIFYYFFI